MTNLPMSELVVCSRSFRTEATQMEFLFHLLPFLIIGVRRVLLDRLYGGREQCQSWSNGYRPAYLVSNGIVGLSAESALNSRLATTKVASVAAQHGEFEMLRLEVRICV